MPAPNENAQAVVDALRSGDYAQCKGRLRVVDEDGGSSYCCLGVACDVYALRTGSGEWDGDEFVVDNGYRAGGALGGGLAGDGDEGLAQEQAFEREWEASGERAPRACRGESNSSRGHGELQCCG